MVHEHVPPNKINLRVLLVSGKKQEFLFTPKETADEIVEFIFNNWPEEWIEERTETVRVLRLIYQGRFIHRSVTLESLGLPTGRTTVMHLVERGVLHDSEVMGDRTLSGHYIWAPKDIKGHSSHRQQSLALAGEPQQSINPSHDEESQQTGNSPNDDEPQQSTFNPNGATTSQQDGNQ